MVWRERKQKVLDEIRRMVNEEESNEEGVICEPIREERFKYRTTTGRKFYDMMTAEEKAMIQGKVDKHRVDDSPLDIQRR
jgi:hypothetical protein